MDFLQTFDLDLDKEIYYAGETVSGRVLVENTENMRFTGIRLHIRGKAHAEWKITRAGERRTIRQDEHYIDDRQTLWGKGHGQEASDDSNHVPIMPRGSHTFPFEFKLPESALPCSFESKYGTIRYYIRVTLDIPYASCPQGVKYFTIIGPHIDCMDERLLTPAQGTAKRNRCSLCCGKGPLLMRGMMERTGYCCGENVRLKVEIQNGGDHEAWARCQLVQHVEFFINKGVLGLTKEIKHVIAEAESERVAPHNSSTLHSLSDRLHVPVCPPTMVEVCGLVQIYYSLQLFLETEQDRDAAEINLPITIATLPFRIPNTPTPEVHYEEPAETVEGGNYISSEFQLGQVYMGDDTDLDIDRTIIYRPVYVTIRASRPPSVCRSTASSRTNLLQVPGGSRVRNMTRSRENLVVHVNGSRHSSHEDLSRLSRVHLDSSEDHGRYSDDDSLGGGARGACGGKAEPERVPLMSRGSPVREGEGPVGMRTATSAAAMGVAAAAPAATSPPPMAAWVETEQGQCDGQATPIEIVDCRLSSV
ncbi:arrestin domain-containing protein 3-like [Littorina saxatilis]|uniref:Arrestin C-terminal-like domain-containing protein n=1 Tax=Littorina saxatilis TaxID=31220 RepID=A0AAN9GA26_9CAEN